MSCEVYVKNGNGESYTNGNGKIKEDKSNFYNESPPRTSSPCFAQVGEVFTFEIIDEIKNYLFERTKIRPKIGIICGTGLGHLAENLTDVDSFPYESIPNFPISTVSGHAGKMVFGYLNGVEVMCMQGRFHYYEGYQLSKCSMPVRVMKVCGCTHLIVTNAAGGLNPAYKVGDIMIVKDHINIMGFAGNSPLQGPNDPRFGPRFPPMDRAYDPQLVKIAQEVVKEMSMENETQIGVYTCVGGPNFETVAELRVLKLFGVDAVGMSTVHEVITARHCDMKVFAFSLITNMCHTDYERNEEANHDSVVAIGLKSQEKITTFVTRIIKEIDYLTQNKH